MRPWYLPRQDGKKDKAQKRWCLLIQFQLNRDQ